MDDAAGIVRVLKALADETRLRLVVELATRGEVSCGEFAVMCQCSNPTLTYHQRILGDAGLIRIRRAGQFRYMILDRSVLESILPGFLDKLAPSNYGTFDQETVTLAAVVSA